jgi:hypothetical protein
MKISVHNEKRDHNSDSGAFPYFSAPHDALQLQATLGIAFSFHWGDTLASALGRAPCLRFLIVSIAIASIQSEHFCSDGGRTRA